MSNASSSASSARRSIAARGPTAGRSGARPSRSASTRTCSSTGCELHPRRRVAPRSPRRRAARHRAGLARDRGAPRTCIDIDGPLGLRGGLRRAARLRPRLPVRPRARGLPRPHHHRHARRADLLVPADRGALHPGAAAADSRRRTRSEARRCRQPFASSISTCRATTAIATRFAARAATRRIAS